MSKINISHYLNDKLKPKVEKDSEYYPVYIRVTYRSKNFRFKSQLVPHCSNEIELEKFENRIKVEREIIEYYINTINDNDFKSTDLIFALFCLATRFSTTFLYDNNQIILTLDREINKYLEKNTIFNITQIYLLRGKLEDTKTLSPMFLKDLDISFISDEKLKITIDNYKNLLDIELKNDIYICPFTFKMDEKVNKYVNNKLNNKNLLSELIKHTNLMFSNLK